MFFYSDMSYDSIYVLQLDELKSKDRQLQGQESTVRRREEHSSSGIATPGSSSSGGVHSNPGTLERRKPKRQSSSHSLHEDAVSFN